jgi:transcriptional regulator with XRE-family HTH domain
MSPLHKVGMRIQRLREKRELSQEALSKKAGVSRGYLARLETGRHDPSLSTLIKIGKALKVKVSDLVD